MWVHCCMNRGFERAVTKRTRPSASGMLTSATRASSGEMVNIITTTPTIVSEEVSIWPSVCCMLWATLSMSLVTLLSRSPRAFRST